MRKKLFLLSLCVICWLTAPTASKGDDSSANRLFVEAAQLINGAKETSATRAFTLLRDAERKLQAIVQHHPSSNLAVKLVSKQPIGSISLAGVANAIKKVSAQAGSRVFSETLDALELVEDVDSRADLLAEVAIAQANFGDVEGSRRTSAKVLTVANSINDGYVRVDTLLKVAEAQTQTGRVEDARETLSEAFTTARSLEDHNGLLAVARAQAEAGDMKAAKEILDEALTEARSHEVNGRIFKLRAIAKAQAATGEMKAAREIFDEALTTAESAGLTLLMWHIALERLQIGDVKGAMATVRTERRLTSNDDEALNSFSIIAQGVYNPIFDGAGDPPPFTTARNMLHEIKDRFESKRLQQKLQNAIEQTEHRREIFIEMRTIALSIEDSSDRDLALQGIVEAQVEVDYYSQIKADYSKDALVTAGMIEQADARNSALFSIALRQVKPGNIERAIVFAQIIEERTAQRNRAFSEITEHLCTVRNIERALTTARMIEDADQRAAAFVVVASTMAEMN